MVEGSFSERDYHRKTSWETYNIPYWTIRSSYWGVLCGHQDRTRSWCDIFFSSLRNRGGGKLGSSSVIEYFSFWLSHREARSDPELFRKRKWIASYFAMTDTGEFTEIRYRRFSSIGFYFSIVFLFSGVWICILRGKSFYLWLNWKCSMLGYGGSSRWQWGISAT